MGESFARQSEELKAWRKVHLPDVIVRQMSRNTWICVIPDANGVDYYLRISFSPHYPMVPPQCIFMPPIVHPKVDVNGIVILDMFRKWQPSYWIKDIVLHIQEILNDAFVFVVKQIVVRPAKYSNGTVNLSLWELQSGVDIQMTFNLLTPGIPPKRTVIDAGMVDLQIFHGWKPSSSAKDTLHLIEQMLKDPQVMVNCYSSCAIAVNLAATQCITTKETVNVQIPSFKAESSRTKFMRHLYKMKCQNLCQHVRNSRTNHQTFATFDFDDLAIYALIQRALFEVGIYKASEMQFLTLPLILAETSNIFVLGQIGNGKSTAIAIAMSELVKMSNNSIMVLCFVHTKISAVQMERRVDLLNKYTGVESSTVYTNHPLTQAKHILIGTPQELAKLVLNDEVPVHRIRFVFFDDADVTMQFGYVKSAVIKLSGLAKFVAFSSSVVHNVQQIIPDLELLTLCKRAEVMNNKITHFVAEVNTFHSKMNILSNLIDGTEENVIIFSSTKKQLHKVYKLLCHDYGVQVAAITGDLDMRTVFMIWKKFCDGEIRILIGTDVISRCIGSENVCLVINFDTPNMLLYFKVYQYRAGRTGRFGKSGSVLTLLSKNERSEFTTTFGMEYRIALRSL